MPISQLFEELHSRNSELKAIYYYIYYKCTFGCYYLRGGQRPPAGPEGHLNPPAEARRRVDIGHPNLLVMVKPCTWIAPCSLYTCAAPQTTELISSSSTLTEIAAVLRMLKSFHPVRVFPIESQFKQ